MNDMVNTAVTSPITPKPKKVYNRKSWPLILLVVVAMAGIGGSYYFYKKYNDIKTNPNAAVQKEVTALVATVGKLMELPLGETPTVATISDKSKLVDQVFFKTAANGDKLLVYNAAMTAILYRPGTNKIINVAPITINQPSNTNSASANTNSSKTDRTTTTNTNR